jgi:hypothetical protein
MKDLLSFDAGDATNSPIARCTLWPFSAASLAPFGPVGETLATWSVLVSDGAFGGIKEYR